MKTAQKESSGSQIRKIHKEKSKNYIENVTVGKHAFKVQTPQKDLSAWSRRKHTQVFMGSRCYISIIKTAAVYQRNIDTTWLVLNADTPQHKSTQEDSFNYGTAWIRLAYGGLSWLLINAGRPSPSWVTSLPVVLGCLKEFSERVSSQASRQHDVFIPLCSWWSCD